MDSAAPEKPLPAARILSREIDEEMKTSYLDYAMSVLIARALPDVRDGLKPVHRRVLYAMFNDLGLLHNKPTKKSARIVGDVMGRYHPHGDAAIYETLVRMAQEFSLRYPLVDGQGNFGSLDGDGAAAMRYTEAKLTKMAEDLLQDIDKDTVLFVPNYDNSLKEPSVLPSKIPNLLINGSSGIAVGMATNIPPHNLGEVAEAVVAQIDNPGITVEQLMGIVKAPDFPTGGIICGLDGVRAAYRTGKGLITVRAKSKTEQVRDRQRIIVSEIPYQVNKAQLIEEMALLVNQKKLTGISDLRDESDRDGMRIVIELKKDANSEVVINQLFAHTRLETTFGVMMIALVDNEPKTLGLVEMISAFISHRKEVITRRTQFDLNKATEKAHILEGLITALANIDAVIELIKKSRDAAMAKIQLQGRFKISEKQSLAILDMRLQRLAALEQEKLKADYKETVQLIKELRDILASEKRILDIIKKEMSEVRQKYSDSRRSEIQGTVSEVEVEDLIAPQDVVVTITHNGYIKRLSTDTYKQQRRGGKGIIAAETSEQDFIETIFVANTHSYILFFTDLGMVHWLKVHKIPEASRQAMGKAIVNLLELENEKVTALVPIREFSERHFITMATKKGIIKKTNLMSFSKPRRGGIIAVTLDEGDELIGAELTDGNKNIILATKNGMAARFEESDVRPTGRSSQGVRGIRLKFGDEVIGMVVADDTKTLLTVTENGYGKRTNINEYRLISRGGIGVINIQATDRNGKAVAIKPMTTDDEIMLISKKGIMIRSAASDISVIGRNTQGVRVMKLDEDDKVVGAAVIEKENVKEQISGSTA